LFNLGNLRRPLGSFASFHLIEASPQRNSIAYLLARQIVGLP